MRRILVLGGLGFFGGAAVAQVREAGLRPIVAARCSRAPRTSLVSRFSVASRVRGAGSTTGADLTIDAEDRASLRAGLRAGDVVIDAAGPFQERTTALVEAAIDVGFDVIDLSDSLDYALAVGALRSRIESAGIRVLTSCSSISSVVAALVRRSGIEHPVRVSVFLAPATRDTARAGTTRSLLHSLGRPIRVLRAGRLVTVIGWSEFRPFVLPPPIDRVRGYLMESVHSVTLPAIWPSLREADFWVDSRIPGLNRLLALAARAPAGGRLVGRVGRWGLPVARLLGSTAGGMRVETEGDGRISAIALMARRGSYLIAVAPAVLAARAIAEGCYSERGLVPPDRHVNPESLMEELRRLGIEDHAI